MKYLFMVMVFCVLACEAESPSYYDTETDSDTSEQRPRDMYSAFFDTETDTECELIYWRVYNCYHEWGCDPDICDCDWAGMKETCNMEGIKK